MKLRSKFSLFYNVCMVAMAVLLFFLSFNISKSGYETCFEQKATGDLSQMHQLLDYECPGEYEVKDDGFYKGEVKLDENNDLVDGLSKLSGDNITIFNGDTRIATTFSENGKRMTGTKAASNVIDTVIKGGKNYIGVANILGQNYVSAYMPIKTSDGKEMLTWIILPPNFDPNKKYPTLLFCEGGPQSPVSQFWSYRWNFMIMASNGYVVVAPNRRGLPGFGQEWLEEISGDWTGQCMKDYLAAIDDAAENLPYVDKDKLGAVGASFGGFSVYYLAGHHDKRFKAFISHDGAFNLESMYTDTEEVFFSNWEYDDAFWNKDQTANATRTYEYSPHKFVDKWDTPILCIHGEKDYRIVYNQGMGAFNAARLRGIPAELLIFPDENHWVLKPQNGILWQRTFFNWLDRWLK